MVLAVEIGNSLIKFGVYKRRKLKEFKAVSTENFKKNPSLPPIVEKNIERIAIASVVPEVNDKITEILKRKYRVNPEIITHQNCKLKLKVKNPQRTGIDRILNCKATYFLFGGPAIVVDIGTAITVDVVSKKGEFMGGVIMPGPGLWLFSLTKTSLLPEVYFDKRVKIVGKDTYQAISSGVKYGLSSAINGVVKVIREKYSVSKIVLTGGWASQFRKKMEFPLFYKPHLTLDGISLFLNGF